MKSPSCHIGAWLLVWAVTLASSKDASPSTPEVKTSRFTHQAHEQAGLKLECSACHGSPANGQLSMPGKDHKPCANEGCHAGEYRKKNTQLCFACHTTSEPWTKNATKSSFKLPTGASSEFYVGFSHKSHLSRGLGSKDPGAACVSCHFEQAGAQPPQIPAGLLAPSHVLCASCHAEIAQPKMPECGKCHAFDNAPVARASARRTEASAEPWRVKAKFVHDQHRVDIRTAKALTEDKIGWERFDKASSRTLKCDACHQGVTEAPVGQRPPRPSMEGCAACHDGKHAFKATGHECVRCHGTPAPEVPKMAPESTPSREKRPK